MTDHTYKNKTVHKYNGANQFYLTKHEKAEFPISFKEIKIDICIRKNQEIKLLDLIAVAQENGFKYLTSNTSRPRSAHFTREFLNYLKENYYSY